MKKSIIVASFIALLAVLTGCSYEGKYDYFEVAAEDYGIATGYAIAFNQGSELVTPVNEVLAKMEEDGTLTCINSYWTNDQSDTCYEEIDFSNNVYNMTHNGNQSELVILTSSGYAPFEMADANGNLSGFDIDLANYIFKELNYTLKWSDVEFDKIVGDITNDQADVAIAAITPTEARKARVDFSNDYFTESFTVAVYRENENLSTLSSLKDKVVAAQSGTVQAELIEKLEAEGLVKRVVLLNYPATAMQSLKTNKIDVLFVEQSIADELLTKYNK